MTDNIKNGNMGEDLAADFLRKKGFEILARNFRYKQGEIDLIVRKTNWLIFVEVKTRSSYAFGYPEEFVDYKKARLILETAEHYIYKTNWEGNVRYDIVSVKLSRDNPEIVHLEDAFY